MMDYRVWRSRLKVREGYHLSNDGDLVSIFLHLNRRTRLLSS